MIYSDTAQLAQIARILTQYVRLPVSSDAVPGAFVEAVLAHVRGAQVLPTYDYIDVLDQRHGVGWSIKSTKAATPVTWKRAKIAGKQALIEASFASPAGCQALGDAIIEFCNAHARASLARFGLAEIGYARLILFPTGEARYFERPLCTRERPDIFDPADFEWRWPEQRETAAKEQLRALHGYRRGGRKMWAWHGLGENQLHFSGETERWPQPGDPHAIAFQLPSAADRLSFDGLVDVLERMVTPA